MGVFIPSSCRQLYSRYLCGDCWNSLETIRVHSGSMPFGLLWVMSVSQSMILAGSGDGDRSGPCHAMLQCTN